MKTFNYEIEFLKPWHAEITAKVISKSRKVKNHSIDYRNPERCKLKIESTFRSTSEVHNFLKSKKIYSFSYLTLKAA